MSAATTLPGTPAGWELWRDRRGRLSGLRVGTLLFLLLPTALILVDAARGTLGSRPLNEVIHRTGWWALMILLVSLAITPLRRTGRWAKLIDVRRMIGVAAALYAVAHLALYTADQGFDLIKVATEIVSRLYLLIGFVALVGLVTLAATSNDRAIRRMGGLRWRRLHTITYGITLLALIHYFQQTKADVSVPARYAGLFAWLIGYRVLARVRGEDALGPISLLGLAVGASALTFLAEAIGVGLSFGQPLGTFVPMFLASAFDTDLGIRPGWWVLGAGLAVTILDAVRSVAVRRRTGPAVPRTS